MVLSYKLPGLEAMTLPLELSATTGEVKEYKSFTEANAKANDGETALHTAAHCDNADGCLVILRHSIFTDVNARTRTGETALQMAELRGLSSVAAAIRNLSLYCDRRLRVEID